MNIRVCIVYCVWGIERFTIWWMAPKYQIDGITFVSHLSLKYANFHLTMLSQLSQIPRLSYFFLEILLFYELNLVSLPYGGGGIWHTLYMEYGMLGTLCAHSIEEIQHLNVNLRAETHYYVWGVKWDEKAKAKAKT